MYNPVKDTMDACRDIIDMLETFGFESADLPGPGDLKEAIETAGYTLVEETA